MRKLIIISIGLVIFIFGIILLFTRKKDDKCLSFTGGGFNLLFETNGGNKIENMHVCIACSPDSYSDLPIPEKNNNKFLGWYYDNKLTNKVETTNTLNIKPIENVDKNGCKIGYKDITLYAKWSK